MTIRIIGGGGSCDDSNEYSGSIKGENLEWLSDYQLLKKDFALWSYLSLLRGAVSTNSFSLQPMKFVLILSIMK
jgi:hypothetical protein